MNAKVRNGVAHRCEIARREAATRVRRRRRDVEAQNVVLQSVSSART